MTDSSNTQVAPIGPTLNEYRQEELDRALACIPGATYDLSWSGQLRDHNIGIEIKTKGPIKSIILRPIEKMVKVIRHDEYGRTEVPVYMWETTVRFNIPGLDIEETETEAYRRLDWAIRVMHEYAYMTINHIREETSKATTPLYDTVFNMRKTIRQAD